MRSTSNRAFHGSSFHNTTFSGSRNGSWRGSGWHGNTWHNGFHNGFHDGFHRGFGCWNCGFHGGWGWGFGWGWGWGFGWGWGWGGWWNPWWWGPGWGFWGGPAYPWWGYAAYPYPYANYNVTYPAPYSGTDSDNSYNDNSSDNAAPSDDYFQRPSFGGSLDVEPQGSPNTNPDTGNVATTTPTVLVYLKDGTMYTASDYWLVDGKLHYMTSYSTESVVDMDEVDLQRTVDENAKRGVTFTLKPSRNGPAASPDSAPAPQPNGTGTASSDPGAGRDGGATPTASPAPDPIPAPRVQDNSETQT